MSVPWLYVAALSIGLYSVTQSASRMIGIAVAGVLIASGGPVLA